MAKTAKNIKSNIYRYLLPILSAKCPKRTAPTNAPRSADPVTKDSVNALYWNIL
jgi:hypothetical protein